MTAIFREYDQTALDAQYEQRVWAPDMDEVIGRYAAASDAVRARLGEPVTQAYGSSAAERLDVYGVYLFAPAFYWEDVFSMLVLALHTAYLVALATDALAPRPLMFLALAAYAAYVINAAQFLLKLRAARLDQARSVPDLGAERQAA